MKGRGALRGRPGGVAGDGAVPDALNVMDKGLRSLRLLPLSPELHTLNLHGNRIGKIEGLSHLWNLQHLDLSSNQIRRIEGLSSLANLRTLSLSCNLLTKVEGLEKLFNLTNLNLSYNQIFDLSGLQRLHGTQHKISHIDLHNNCVISVGHLLKCTKGLLCLRSLTLEKNGKANPVCHIAGYRETVLQTLPQLTVLDGRNTSGEPVDPAEENWSDVPCLEDIGGSSASSGCSSARDQKCVTLPVVTPHIDQALAHFHQRMRTPVQSAVSSSTELASSSEPEKAKLDQIHCEIRIKKIEDQLSQLMQKVSDTSRSEAPPRALKSKRDADPTSESESGSGKENNRKVVKRSKIPASCRATSSTRSHMNPKNKVTDREEKKSPPKCSHSSQRGCQLNSPSGRQGLEAAGSKAEVVTEIESNLHKVEEIKSTVTEESAYLALIRELDQEKERRWKAEQAEKKLTEHVRELQEQAEEKNNIQSMAVYTTDRLKECILKERDVKARLQVDVQELKAENKNLTNELNQARSKAAEQQKAMQALEETLSKMETQRLQQQTTVLKQVQEAELKASASEREVQLLRTSLRQQKEKLKQLQELLVIREQEQRKELEARVVLNGPEFQNALSKEMAKEEERHKEHIKELQQTIHILNQKYRELQEEFRLALTAEGKRFQEVKEAFENVSAELAEDKQALFELEQKEKEMADLIQDMTGIVKEQKDKIEQLTQANEEATAKLKCLTGELETVTEQDKQKAVEIELLKKENGKLLSQLTAQESLIDGLKMERKIWGQELAQQGAHLAQDRGKLEAKIEALMTELEELKKQKKEDSDTIKIKNKIMDDQTETIRKLKVGSQEKDTQMRKQHEKNLKAQELLQAQLEAKAAEIEELMKKLERQSERKKELKLLLEEKEVELDDLKHAHSALKKEWQGKGELLGQLEVQVKQMKENFDIKEKKLIEERNRSLQTQRIALEKLHKMDNVFKKQLESMVAAHEEELLQLEKEKEKQIEEANEKVYRVEEEMRQLLQETATNKKTMENKIKQLTDVLNDIQQDI